MSTPKQGQQNVAGQVEVMELTASSQQQLQQHQAVLQDLEAKKVAATVVVPTLPDQVRSALRQLGLPVRFFGENLANVRDRLRMELARRQLGADQILKEEKARVKGEEEEEEEVTKYTRATHSLVEARQAIASFSLERATKRLDAERRLRVLAVNRKRTLLQLKGDDAKKEAENELSCLDEKYSKTYKLLRSTALEGSQYGDSRALSCICSQQVGQVSLVATASWTGTVHLWDGSSPVLESLGKQTMCHEDRIMGMAMQVMDDSALLATASIDMTGKLWKAKKCDVVMTDEAWMPQMKRLRQSSASQSTPISRATLPDCAVPPFIP